MEERFGSSCKFGQGLSTQEECTTISCFCVFVRTAAVASRRGVHVRNFLLRARGTAKALRLR